MKKIYVFIVVSIFTVMAALGYSRLEFSSWDRLKEYSADIVVARCVETPDPASRRINGHPVDFQGLYLADMEIVYILKGVTNFYKELELPKLGPAQMSSEFCPSQHEYYLVFADNHDGFYQATERYRFVPLGSFFHTNSLSGKPLDEQISALLRTRLRDLNREIQRDQEEKARLEQGITH